MMNSFKIFPTPHENRFFEVTIFESRIDYLNRLKRKFDSWGRSLVPFGACILYDEKSNFKLGDIWFYRNEYFISSIMHECLHAGVWYLKRVFKDCNPFAHWETPYEEGARMMEERLCTIQEYLFWQIYNQDNKCGVRNLAGAAYEASSSLEYYNINRPQSKTDDKQQELFYFV